MEELRLDDVFSAVLELWPRCAMTKEEFRVGAWQRLHGYSVEAVRDALKRQRALHLDARRPEWWGLLRELAWGGDGSGGRKNAFQLLLDQIRKHMEAERFPGWQDMSDNDVYQNHLAANPGGAKGIHRGWLGYFKERGEDPPACLAEENA